MKRKKRKVLITEFAIQVYSDGVVVWDGFDKFLLWKLTRKPKEGYLPYARKIQRFSDEEAP
ncbi:MAG: hypothetical protein WC687_04425 [Patescibacteria group bacterium]|jgi:hypothetical protein